MGDCTMCWFKCTEHYGAVTPSWRQLKQQNESVKHVSE